MTPRFMTDNHNNAPQSDDDGDTCPFCVENKQSELQASAAEADNNDESDEKIKLRVRQWLEEVIVGLNLCPFAEKSVRGVNSDTGEPLLRIAVVRDSGEGMELAQKVHSELEYRRPRPGTTLVVCPNCFPNDFVSFWLFVSTTIERDLLEAQGYQGILQIAPFHPYFVFEGSETFQDYDDVPVDNWTNKSPYPILHILREDEVEGAVDKLEGDAGRVWKRNVNLLHAIHDEMGMAFLERLYQGTLNDQEKTRLKQLLRQFRTQMTL